MERGGVRVWRGRGVKVEGGCGEVESEGEGCGKVERGCGKV